MPDTFFSFSFAILKFLLVFIFPFSLLPDGSFTYSPRLTSATSTDQITSTPKHPPRRLQHSAINRMPVTHASPTPRSRTEILDTNPQHLLSASDNSTSWVNYTSRLGPRQDNSFFHKVPSGVGEPKKRMQQRRLSAREKLGAKSRRSPRNLSVVSAPKDNLSQSMRLNSTSRKHRILNESVQSVQRGVTPTRQRPQSSTVPSPRQQRYNLRRPRSTTPKFGRSRELQQSSLKQKPSLYQSEFLNSYYGKQDQENMEDIRVQRSYYPGRLLDCGNARSPRRRVLDTTPKPKSILLTPANKSIKVRL